MNIQIKKKEGEAPEIYLVSSMDTLKLPDPSINKPDVPRNNLTASDEMQILKWFVAHMK